MKLLSFEENHDLLIDSYVELMTIKTCLPVTLAAEMGDPPTIYAKNFVYYNSFLPKTVREFKANFS